MKNIWTGAGVDIKVTMGHISSCLYFIAVIISAILDIIDSDWSIVHRP